MRAHAPSLVIAAALCWLIASLATPPPASAVEEASASAETEEAAPSRDEGVQETGEAPELPAEAEPAETPEPTLAPLESLARDEKIEQLYVTATKREESLQEVAISMAALDSGFLEAAGTTQFLQLQQYVPNLSINPVTDTRGTIIRIRGIGSVGNNSGIDPSVGVFIDGVYQGRAGMSVADLLDIERVEVLRGPQGTLYGKNTAAGLINIISKRPSYEPEATLEGVFGKYANYEGRGMVNYPLVDEHIATRLSGYWVARDGFDINIFDDSRVNDDNRWGIKSRTAFDVTDAFSVLVTADYSYQDNRCCVADILSYNGAPTLQDGKLKQQAIDILNNAPNPPGGIILPDPWDDPPGTGYPIEYYDLDVDPPEADRFATPSYPVPTAYPIESWDSPTWIDEDTGLTDLDTGFQNDPRGVRGPNPATGQTEWWPGPRTSFQFMKWRRNFVSTNNPYYDPSFELPKLDPFDRRVNADQEAQNEVTIGGVAIDATYDIGDYGDIPFLDDATLNFIGAWRHYESSSQFDGDFTLFDAVLSWTDTKLDQFSAELRLTSPGGELLDYQVGLYFYHQTQDTVDVLGTEGEWHPTWTLINNAVRNTGDNTHKTFSYAAFGQFTLSPVEWFSATGGLRVTSEKKTRVGTQNAEYYHWVNVPAWSDINVCAAEWHDGSNPGNPHAANCRDAPPILGPPTYRDQSREVANVSWLANLRFFPTEDLMLYASAATGFKSGGFNQLRTTGPVPGEFDDEESLNIEGGFRSSWFERMLTLNATGFWTRYEDFQAQVFNGSAINVLNAATLESYGVEADLMLVPTEYLMIGSSLGFNIAEYGKFENGLATAWHVWESTLDHPGGTFACGIEPKADPDDPDGPFGPPLDGVEDQTGEWAEKCVQDLTGRTLDNAPRWSVSAWAQGQYLLPWWPFEVFLRAEYAYTSSRFLDVDLDRNLLQTDTHLVNLRAGIRADNGRWELTAWVKNLTDEQYNVVGFDVPTINGFAAINGPPRQYGLTLRVNFGALVD